LVHFVPIFSGSSLKKAKFGNISKLRHGAEGRHTIDSNIAQGSRTIVLNVRVRRIEQADKDGDSTRIYQLLPVLIWKEWHMGFLSRIQMSNRDVERT
jgi:hypothetical protein